MELYNEEQKKIKNELSRRKKEIEDLKVSYGYAALKESFTPFKMQSRIQMIDRLNLSASLHNGWIGTIKNYGEFVKILQEYDTFDKEDNELREEACKIIHIGNEIKSYNEYLQNHQEFVMEENPIVMNKEFYKLAKEYLIKMPQIKRFEKANYRRIIIKQAIYDLNKEQIEKAIKGHLILPDEVEIIANESLLIESKNFQDNLKLCQNYFNKEGKAKENNPTITTTLVGVTFASEKGGINRQEILKTLKDIENPILNVIKGSYNNQPTYQVQYEDKDIGYISQNLANQIDKIYKDTPIKCKLMKVTGGGDMSYGCNVRLEISLHKENIKEKEKENIKE